MCAHAGDEYVSSGLSEHSSDRLQPSSKPQLVPLTTKETESEDTDGISDSGSNLLTPSASESNLGDGKPITLQKSVNAGVADTRKEVCVHVHVLIVNCLLYYSQD